VKAAIAADAVAYAMRKNMLGFSKPVYMVTGTKIASGAAVTYSEGQSMKNQAHLGIDATSASVPLSLGPKGHWNMKTDGNTSFKRESDFLFAYRLVRIRRTDGQIDDYDKGAFLSTDPDDEELVVRVDAVTDEGASSTVAVEKDGEEVWVVTQNYGAF
jgi:hypothetical protein